VPYFQTGLAEKLNVGDRRVLDRGKRNAGCAGQVGAKGRVAGGELFRIGMMWALVERRDPSTFEGMGKLNGMVVSYEMVNRQMSEDVATARLERDMRLEQEQIRRTGSGVDVEGEMAWACEVERGEIRSAEAREG
jgi:hypothetical protein